MDHSEGNLLNPRIYDHLLIEEKLSKVRLDNEAFYSGKDELVKKLLNYQEKFTYEPEPQPEEQKEEELEEELSEISLNSENIDDLEEEEEMESTTSKVVVRETRDAQKVEIVSSNDNQPKKSSYLGSSWKCPVLALSWKILSQDKKKIIQPS